MRSWEESKVTSEFSLAVERTGYKTLSPIQRAAIHLDSNSVMLSALQKLVLKRLLFCVLPMELAQQIEEETVKFAHYLGLSVTSIVGGLSIEEHGFKITQGCEIVILSCPGRLIDCLDRRYAVYGENYLYNKIYGPPIYDMYDDDDQN
ncbi:hypothetical protein Bca4012_064277 [Brassica carinata]|uniref:Uncharacterized protein n=1 Tax=Brassica carinata TaxID=52824 RepID=A0A8X7V9P8_BRACI|nr:hypothetical protein Bca52824_033862 [Brassica carinata]